MFLGAAVLLIGIANGRIFCANSGHCSAILLRKTPLEPIWIARGELMSNKSTMEWERIRAANAVLTEDGMVNGIYPSGRAIGFTSMFPTILPDPRKFCIQIMEDFQFIVMGKGRGN